MAPPRLASNFCLFLLVLVSICPNALAGSNSRNKSSKLLVFVPMKSLILKVLVGKAGPSGPGYNNNLELTLLCLVVICLSLVGPFAGHLTRYWCSVVSHTTFARITLFN